MSAAQGQAYAARVAAVSALAKDYRDRPASIGGRDCVKAVVFTCRHRSVKLPTVRRLRYTSERGAITALARQGHASLIDAVDAQGFERIPLAMSWPGDLVAYPAPNYAPPFDVALYVIQYAGGSVVFGIDPVTKTFQSCEPKSEASIACWRVS
jgi:hypothetical protein